MRRTLSLLTALTLIALPAAAQERTASQGREGTFFFRADAPFAKVVLPYTVDQVWRAMPDAYQLLGFTGTADRDTTKKDFKTGFMQIRGQLYEGEPNSLYFECSRNSMTGPLADQGDITFAILSRVEPNEGGGTAVLTQLSARVRRRDASQYPVDCGSTGRLERTLAQFLTQRLQTSGGVEIRRRN
jgi:hypothetical protein